MDCEAFQAAFRVMICCAIACREVYTAIIIPEELLAVSGKCFGTTKCLWWPHVADILIESWLVKVYWVRPALTGPNIGSGDVKASGPDT